MRVLVVEDEPLLADAIVAGLTDQGLASDVAYDGEAALEKATVNRYDVVVLDRDLPRVSGDRVCRTLVSQGTGCRILMLTAAGDIDSRVEGLNLGADDYLGKPFAFTELVARIRALGRRSPEIHGPVLTCGDVMVDTARHLATRGGRPLLLTRKEFAVLEVLVSAAGAVVSAEELLERAWDEMADPFTNAVRITVMNLRRKLGEPSMLETVIGVGYRTVAL